MHCEVKTYMSEFIIIKYVQYITSKKHNSQLVPYVVELNVEKVKMLLQHVLLSSSICQNLFTVENGIYEGSVIQGEGVLTL